MKLYSYALRTDDGAAPNPYGGLCTLAICKPAIRRTAKEGDWIVALGPTQAPDSRNLSGSIVCAMKVASKLTFEEYDTYCREHLPNKLPQWYSGAPFERLVGDCIYYPAGPVLQQRASVHGASSVVRDLSGKFVVLADEFYYFGDQAVELPEEFRMIRCLVPCDHIPRRSWPLFRAKAMLGELIAGFSSPGLQSHQEQLAA